MTEFYKTYKSVKTQFTKEDEPDISVVEDETSSKKGKNSNKQFHKSLKGHYKTPLHFDIFQKLSEL